MRGLPTQGYPPREAYMKGLPPWVYLRGWYMRGLPPWVYLRGCIRRGLPPWVYPRGRKGEVYHPGYTPWERELSTPGYTTVGERELSTPGIPPWERGYHEARSIPVLLRRGYNEARSIPSSLTRFTVGLAFVRPWFCTFSQE